MTTNAMGAALRIALLGCGVVGADVVRLLHHQANELTTRIGAPLELIGIAVRRPGRDRGPLPLTADMFTADIRAAKDLGYNTQEYLWVKAQILAVSSSAVGQKLASAMSASMDSAYANMKKQYDEAKDEQTKAALKQTLDQYEQTRKESASAQQTQEDPALAYNRQLLSKYEDAINAFANEMAKWEDKPGDAQKAMQDFNKNVDKAVNDAKKEQ